jgi:hypothetical protein
VTVADKPAGVTPVDVDGAPCGSVAVAVAMSGFDTWTNNVTVAEGTPGKVAMQLHKPAPQINSTPRAPTGVTTTNKIVKPPLATPASSKKKTTGPH